MEIKKYEPMIEVETFDGMNYFTLAKNRSAIEKDWSEKKLVRIEGVTMASSNIKRIKDAGEIFNISTLQEPLRGLVKDEIKLYASRHGKQPRQNILLNMIERVRKENDL